MCTQGHEYRNSGLDVKSSTIINRLPTPMANKEENMASSIDRSSIGLPSMRNDLMTSTRQFQEKGFNFIAALSTDADHPNHLL